MSKPSRHARTVSQVEPGKHHLNRHVEFRVSTRMAAALENRASAAQLGVSEFLRRLLEQELALELIDPALQTLDALADDDQPPEHRKPRIELALTDSELAALDAHVVAAGFSSRARFLMSALRSLLTGLPMLSENDLQALGQATVELAAVGRNLNQVARALNAQRNVDTAQIQATVGTLASAIKTVTREVGAVLGANRRRWWMRERQQEDQR